MFHLAVSSILLSLLPRVTPLQYELIRTYTPANFFEEFSFYTGPDPTGGFVEYVPFETAVVSGLIGNASDQIYLGVDHTNVYQPGGPGRASVRLESKLTFTEGLFVADLSHIPSGCGIWPAFWTVGLGDWPADGEIDIIENINDAINNNAALHAAGDCAVDATAGQTSTWKSTDCNIIHDGNQGCGTEFTEPNNYGADFNLNGGGVYAMEWTSSVINIWYFPPINIPQSLLDSTSYVPEYSHPDTATFGPPSASFAGPCSSSFGDKFFNHTIILDTTFCGAWAGSNFGKGDSQCPLLEGLSEQDSCIDFVANNPELFTEAYWALKSLRVWQKIPGLAPEYYLNEPTTPVIDVPLAPTLEVQTPAVEEPVAVIPVANTPEAEDFEVSPLTGGVLQSGDLTPQLLPVPIDPGIGDGTVLSGAPSVPAPAIPPVWNTEEQVDTLPLSPTLLPQVPDPAETPLTLNSLPDITSLWGALGVNSQDQLLALSNQLATAADGASVPTIEEPSIAVADISPTPGENLPPVPLIDLSLDTVAEIPYIPIGGLPFDLGANIPLTTTVDEPTTPLDLVQQLPDLPPIPPLAPEDTSQAIGSILGLLDDSTKNQLLALISVTSQPSSRIMRRGKRTATINLGASSHEKKPKKYPGWCYHIKKKANPPVGSSEWFIKFVEQYIIFIQFYESLSDADQTQLAQIFVGNIDPPEYIADKRPCGENSPVGSPAWIQEFARDYRTFLEILNSATDAQRQEIYKLIADLTEGSGMFKRDVASAAPAGDIDSRWGSLSDDLKARLRGFGSSIKSITTADSDKKTIDDDYIKALVTAVQRLYKSSDDNEKVQLLSLLVASAESRRVKIRQKRGSIGRYRNDDDRDRWDSERPDRVGLTGRPGHYRYGYSYHHPYYEDLTWQEVYDSLDPESQLYADQFVAMYLKYHGEKPEVTSNLGPYVDYIEGWQNNYDSLDPDTQAELLEWIIHFKYRGVGGRWRSGPWRPDRYGLYADDDDSDYTYVPIGGRAVTGKPVSRKSAQSKQPAPRHFSDPRPSFDDEGPYSATGYPSFYYELDDEEPWAPDYLPGDPDPEVADDVGEVADAAGYPWSSGPKKAGHRPWSSTPKSAYKALEDEYNDLALWDALPDGAKDGILDTLAPSPDELERRHFEGESDGDSSEGDSEQQPEEPEHSEELEEVGEEEEKEEGEEGEKEDEEEDAKAPTDGEIVENLKRVSLQLQDIIDEYINFTGVDELPSHADENANTGGTQGSWRSDVNGPETGEMVKENFNE